MHGHDWNDLVDRSLRNWTMFTGNKPWLAREITSDHEIVVDVVQSALQEELGINRSYRGYIYSI